MKIEISDSIIKKALISNFAMNDEDEEINKYSEDDILESLEWYIKNEDGKVLRLKSGIVNLKTKDVTQNTEYTTDTKETGYVNGNYGADAQYLGTSFNG